MNHHPWPAAQPSPYIHVTITCRRLAHSPNKSSGNIFMKYGNELTFHTKVDFTRLAFAQ